MGWREWLPISLTKSGKRVGCQVAPLSVVEVHWKGKPPNSSFGLPQKKCTVPSSFHGSGAVIVGPHEVEDAGGHVPLVGPEAEAARDEGDPRLVLPVGGVDDQQHVAVGQDRHPRAVLVPAERGVQRQGVDGLVGAVLRRGGEVVALAEVGLRRVGALRRRSQASCFTPSSTRVGATGRGAVFGISAWTRRKPMAWKPGASGVLASDCARRSFSAVWRHGAVRHDRGRLAAPAPLQAEAVGVPLAGERAGPRGASGPSRG